MPGDYKGGWKPPLSSCLVAVGSRGILALWVGERAATRSTTASTTWSGARNGGGGSAKRISARGLRRPFARSPRSSTAGARHSQALQAEFDAWRRRDLSGLKVLYLFVDGQFHAARAASEEKEGILAAYALCEDGTMVLLHLGLGPGESTDAWVACLHDLTARGLQAPLLVVLDGNPGLRKAVRQVFPGVRVQRCQVHKLRNILAKLPRLAVTQLKPLLQQVFLAPDHGGGH